MAKFVPRERKQKRLAKQTIHSNGADSNPAEVIPETKSEREARRTKLAAELRELQPQSKITSKKRKRLDKYVDTKLKKEENLEFLKKLAAHKVDTSLLQSSKKLGRVGETKRERYGRALREQAVGVDDGRHDGILYEQRQVAVDDESQLEASQDDEPTTVAQVAPQTTKPLSSFGSGLKRPLEVGKDGQPVIKKRKRRERNISITEAAEILSEEEASRLDDSYESEDGNGDEEDEWSGFDADEPSTAAISPAGAGAESDMEQSSPSSSVTNDGDGTSEPKDDEDSDSESAPSVASDRKERVSAFKQWADSQRNVALDFTPSAAPTNDAAVRASFRPRQPSPDPMPPSIQPSKAERTSRPAAAITIPRSEEIQAARLELPVVQEEQKIMEAIHSNPIVIVCGATGSGKTTQVPQMMLEGGYGSYIGERTASDTAGPQSKGMIGVTQPRRVAATSVAERVATELGPTYRSRVGHQVRYDANVGRDTAMKFMTDGILLREISQDFILGKYSAIVIDEAHERSVNTDILIGMLSRIVSLRSELAKEEPEKYYPLKLVIMSATLRVSDFAENPRLFRGDAPPIVQAEGRQYIVETHWSRRTQRDFVSETVEKVARGHQKLPPGGMLVFLTSQNDIQTVAKRLKDKLGSNTAGYSVGKARREREQMLSETDDFEDETRRNNNDYLEGEEEDASDSDAEITGLDLDTDDAEFLINEEAAHFGPRDRGVLKPHILPLYAALPPAQQLRVFQPAPEGSRLIVLATNVAETSLTIPGVRYVFDCGRAKEKRYDMSTGVQTFEVDWISKASASQRAGRAGRTGPGHCYRLYSSAVYEQFFAEHTVPEILRTPLESTVLQLKAMDINNVVNFPFPTAPDGVQLAQAERLLRNLGAIEDKDGRITARGMEVMGFPVSPRFGRMLLLAKANGVLEHGIAVVAGLAVGDLFIPEAQTGVSGAEEADEVSEKDDSDEERYAKRQAVTAAQTAAQKRHQDFTRSQAKLSSRDDGSDVMKLLTAIAVYAEKSAKDQPMAAASQFCEEFFLREKGMSEVQMLRRQLHNIVSARQSNANVTAPFTDKLEKPTDIEMSRLNQVVAAGFIDQIAIRADLLQDEQPAFGRKPRRATEVAYRTLVQSAELDMTLSPQEQEMQRSVFVHPSSVLAHLTVSEMPKYVAYSHLSRAPPSTISSSKVSRTRMHPVTTVTAKQLAVLAEGTPLLELGKPIGKIEEVSGSGAKQRRCWISVAVKAPDGGTGWPLCSWKVLQKRGKRDWEVEKVLAR